MTIAADEAAAVGFIEELGYQGFMAFSYAFDIVIAPVQVSDAHQVAGKWNTDIFYVSPWSDSPRINVTNTSANEILPDWNPAWVVDLP